MVAVAVEVAAPVVVLVGGRAAPVLAAAVGPVAVVPAEWVKEETVEEAAAGVEAAAAAKEGKMKETGGSLLAEVVLEADPPLSKRKHPSPAVGSGMTET